LNCNREATLLAPQLVGRCRARGALSPLRTTARDTPHTLHSSRHLCWNLPMTWGRVVAALAVLAAGCTHREELAADGSPLEVGHAVTARPRAGGEVDGVIVKGPLGGYRVRLERPRRELELGELTS